MARKNLSNEIQHDGTADTFFARQGESLRHWAAPKVESALAWAETSAAFGEIGGKAAATEGRRFAETQVAPQVKDTTERVNSALQDRYEKVAPVVAGVGSSLQGLLATAQDRAQQVGQDLQDRAEQTRQEAAKAAKRNRKAAKKAAKRGGKRTVELKKDARGFAQQASKKADRTQSFLSSAASEVKGSAAQGGLTVAGLLAAAVAAAQDKSTELAPQVRERLDQAQHFAQDRREEYVPKAAATLAGVADRAEKGAQDLQVPAAVEQLLVALTGDKAAVKHLRKSAQQSARQAKKDLQKRAQVESGSNGRGWILAGMAATAAGAGLAVWKLTTPVQDPWAAPVPGPIIANIPVVHSVEGSADPYAKQKQAVAETNAAPEARR